MALPFPSRPHEKLLTIDTNSAVWVKDALGAGIDVCPLFLDVQNGIWVLRVKFAPGVVLPRHFHTGTVHLYTMSGSWNYVEFPDQPQTSGSYLYEPGGSVHQFMTPSSNIEPTDTFMVVYGANVNFDEEGNFINITDAGQIDAVIRKAARNQGLSALNYIRGLGSNNAGVQATHPAGPAASPSL